MSKSKNTAAKSTKKPAVKKTSTATKNKTVTDNKAVTAAKSTSAAKSTVSKTATKENKTKSNNSSATKKDNSSCYNVKLAALIIVSILIGAFLTKVLFSGSSNKSSDNKQVEEIVANWVENNPELILESVINMQKEQAQKQMEDANKNVSKRLDDLYKREQSPKRVVAGADVTIVEFFDYNCGYCKRALGTIEELIKKDKKVNIIFKELPILGKSSEDLSKVSLAFNLSAPSRYFDFHRDLMKSNSRTAEDAMAIAQKHGVKASIIKKVMTKFKKQIDEEIAFNRELSRSIGVNGTPAFLVEESIFPGAVGLSTLEEAIKEKREANK